MKKKYLCNVILILSIFMGGCSTDGNVIAEHNNMEDNLVLGDSNTSVDDVDNEKETTENEERTMDIQSTENEMNNTLTGEEELTMDIQSTENEINNTPTRDEDTANQIAEIKNQMEKEISAEVSITIQDITDGKLIISLENTSDEGIAMGEICVMENKDGNWSEVERKSNVISELPSHIIQPKSSKQIEFDYVTRYGELSKGLYICAININGVSIQAEFEID